MARGLSSLQQIVLVIGAEQGSLDRTAIKDTYQRLADGKVSKNVLKVDLSRAISRLALRGLVKDGSLTDTGLEAGRNLLRVLSGELQAEHEELTQLMAKIREGRQPLAVTVPQKKQRDGHVASLKGWQWRRERYDITSLGFPGKSISVSQATAIFGAVGISPEDRATLCGVVADRPGLTVAKVKMVIRQMKKEWR